jgi:peptidoglycan/xylan/chitin deacetylase (PgdA/CDA1 family)
LTPTLRIQPPYGDVDDRIRAIAQGLGLQTIIWEYDTNDWEEGSDNVTVADIDQNYQVILDAANNGTFNSVCSQH